MLVEVLIVILNTGCIGWILPQIALDNSENQVREPVPFMVFRSS